MSNRQWTDPRTGEVIDPAPIRPFTEVLAELGEGTTLSELSEGMWDLIDRVQETAKAGTLRLTIAVAFDGQGRLIVKDEVAVKLPEFSRPQTRFYVGKGGNATRRDPNQPELPSIADINRKA